MILKRYLKASAKQSHSVRGTCFHQILSLTEKSSCKGGGMAPADDVGGS